jgi:beta-phosphoglucomutase-like phosphatase (HAD superfamily)
MTTPTSAKVMLRGAIFDFNGTLFWDSRLHEEAWNRLSLELRGRPFTQEELRASVHGRTNRAIVETLLGGEAGELALQPVADRKEEIYRGLCLADPSTFRLAPGAAEFLDSLQRAGIPTAIATAAGADNLKFYRRHLPLGRWFSEDRIVYDDGSFPGKPAPDVFLLAASRIGLPPSACAIFEDSFSGIEAAVRAGAGRIIGITSGNTPEQLLAHRGVSLAVDDFQELTWSRICSTSCAPLRFDVPDRPAAVGAGAECPKTRG